MDFLDTNEFAPRFRTWVKGAMGLVCLLGVTWTCGLLWIDDGHSIVMAYAFTIANSLQGLFIFLFHVVFSDKVITLKFFSFFFLNLVAKWSIFRYLCNVFLLKSRFCIFRCAMICPAGALDDTCHGALRDLMTSPKTPISVEPCHHRIGVELAVNSSWVVAILRVDQWEEV